MPSQLPGTLRRSAGDPSFSIFLVTVVLCLLRARDLPSATVEISGTEVAVGPADIALVVLTVLALLRLRARRTVSAPALLAVSAGFGALVLLSALPNGAGAITAAGKLAELAALTLGAAVFVDTRERLETLLAVVVVYTCAVVAWAAAEFLGAGGGRQGSVRGRARPCRPAPATLALAAGLARLNAARGRNPGLLAVAGLVAGRGRRRSRRLAGKPARGLWCRRSDPGQRLVGEGDLRLAAAVVTIALAGVATAGTLAMRQGELGFLQSLFGPPAEEVGQYSAELQ